MDDESAPNFDVYSASYRLESTRGQAESCVQLKLTDECIAALQKAQRQKVPMRLCVDAQGGGCIELGVAGEDFFKEFKFNVQSLPVPFADAVSKESRNGHYQARASLAHKYTVSRLPSSWL